MRAAAKPPKGRFFVSISHLVASCLLKALQARPPTFWVEEEIHSPPRTQNWATAGWVYPCGIRNFPRADINWQSGESVSRVGKAAGITMYLRLCTPSPFLLSWGVRVGEWRVLVMRKRDSKHALSKCTWESWRESPCRAACFMGVSTPRISSFWKWAG